MGRWEDEKITNYKIQITNKFQITMSKITNNCCLVSVVCCIEIFIYTLFSVLSHLSSHLLNFLSSQLPSFFLYPPGMCLLLFSVVQAQTVG